MGGRFEAVKPTPVEEVFTTLEWSGILGWDGRPDTSRWRITVIWNYPILANSRLNTIAVCICLMCLSSCAPQQQLDNKATAPVVAENKPVINKPVTVEDILTAGKWIAPREYTEISYHFTKDKFVTTEDKEGTVTKTPWEVLSQNEKKKQITVKYYGSFAPNQNDAFFELRLTFGADGQSAGTEFIRYQNSRVQSVKQGPTLTRER